MAPKKIEVLVFTESAILFIKTGVLDLNIFLVYVVPETDLIGEKVRDTRDTCPISLFNYCTFFNSAVGLNSRCSWDY